LGIAWLIGLTVRQISGATRYGVYAGLCWLIWIAAFDTARIGFNDPHLLGILINLAAFYIYWRDSESTRSLILSAALFSLSLFTKQTLVIFPAAVALDLFLTSKKRFVVWLGTAVGSSALFLLLTFAVDGSYFFQHLMLPRQYSVTDMWSNTVLYVTFVQIAFVAALYWALRYRHAGRERMLVWIFSAGYLFGIYLVGGNGAGVNHFYDAMIATTMICGLLAADFEGLAESAPYPRAMLAGLLILPFFISSFLVLPRRIPYDLVRYDGTPALSKEYETAIAFIRSRPGPALCESLMVCFEAGKPEIYDAFAVDQAIKTGHLDERYVLNLLATRHYSSIVISYNPAEALRPVARQRFSQGFMNQLHQNYHPAYRDSRYAIFVPNGS
jgi:hypothetical protein